MSNRMRELVELTAIKSKGGSKKSVLLHMADTVREGDWTFWRSQGNTARRLGLSYDTVSRAIDELKTDGLIAQVRTKTIEGKTVAVFEINVAALLALPCVERDDPRPELVERLAGGATRIMREGYPHNAGGVSASCGASHTIHTLHTSPEKKRDHLSVAWSAEDELERVHRELAAEIAERDARLSQEAG